MKLLLVTGQEAADPVERTAAALEERWGCDEVDVEVLETDLGAFVETGDLEDLEPDRYDLVLVPGLARGDYSRFPDTYKGTKNVANLVVLDPEDLSDLSPKLPADRLLEKTGKEPGEGEPATYIGGLPIGGDTRMKVLAEIVDSTDLDRDDLADRARYFLEQGADMLDLGIPRDASASDVKETSAFARECFDAPLSIDTMFPDQIEAALPYVDLVLSADETVMEELVNELAEAEVAVVVVPGKNGLRENVEEAKKLDLRAVADPILDPPLSGMTESLCRYLDAGELDAPLFFGAGNVTELIDADSQGVNALLAAAAQEVGASILFTPEHSVKTKGSVRELSEAAKMMLSASREDSPPKDLGTDLLLLKDKVDLDETVEKEGKVVEGLFKGYHRDPMGHFRIGLDRDEGKILAVFHPSGNHEPMTFEGREASAIYSEVTRRDLVSLTSHAAYLGAELAKAEEALRTGKSYRQDDPLFDEL